MLDLKLTPTDLDVPVPKFIVEENSTRAQERDKILAALNARILDFKKDHKEEEVSLAEAILCIQTNERGRQGCLRARFIREIR